MIKYEWQIFTYKVPEKNYFKMGRLETLKFK